MLKNLKEKRGSALVLGLVIITLALFFTILIVDLGFGYYTKIHMQTIADAATIAGANYGEQGYRSAYTGRSKAHIIEAKAKQKANQIKNANVRYLPNSASVTATSYNPTRNIDGKYMNAKEQYHSGNLTTRFKGVYKTLFHGGKVLGGSSVTRLNIENESRVKLKSN